MVFLWFSYGFPVSLVPSDLGPLGPLGPLGWHQALGGAEGANRRMLSVVGEVQLSRAW